MIDETFRCSAASRDDHEPLAGSAPTESAYLLVEHPGPWGRQALAESDLPEEVRAHLASESRVRVLLIRRHGRTPPTPSRRVYAAWLGAPGPRLWSTAIGTPAELLDVDLAALAEGRGPDWDLVDGNLWLVCTNGRRDRCCAELGRPIAAELSARWPRETWETTHLGGHRFAGTLLALPTGITLGRLSAESAVEGVAEIESGGHPVANSRGRAGFPAAVQVAEIEARRDSSEAHWVAPMAEQPDGSVTVTFRTDAGDRQLRLVAEVGLPRRQSCADLKEKPATYWRVRD